MTRRLLLCTALLVVPALAFAQAAEERAFLDLVINDVAHGDALVVMRGGDALVPVAALKEAGLESIGGRRETIEGEEYVSLQSLSPNVTFSFNERDLKLAIKVSAALLPAVIRELQSPRPAGVVYRRDSSIFMNYALNAADRRQYDLFTETGATLGRTLLYNTISMTPRGPARGLTNITIDQQSSLRRWVVGDAFVGGAPLGGDGLVGGINISKEFTVDPYFVRYPMLSMSTPVATPSTVEVRVNGRLVRQEQVQPGRLDLRNLPLTTGQNDARVIVRDAFGGTQELSTSYYLTASVLARGVHEYQYSAGMMRTALGFDSWAYERPALFARHRVGVTDTVTLGGRLEAGRDLVSGGPTFNIRLPFGEVETTAALSQNANRRGTAALVSYMYAGRRMSGGGSIRMMTPTYTTLSLLPGAQRPISEASIFAAVPVARRISVTMQHTRSAMSDSPLRLRTALQATAQLFRRADLVVSAAQLRDERGPGTEVLVGMTVRVGGRTTSTISATHDHDRLRTAIDLQQSLPASTGFGYQLRSESESGGSNLSGPANLSGVVQYQGRYGRYEMRREMVGATQRSNVSIAGALVAIGGGVYATRPVRGSYALVRVPGVKDVRGYASNQEVGRTDRGGNLFVPDLLPYYANHLTIADSDVPLDYEISKVDLTLAPPYRGGALALFPVQQVSRISGTIRIIDGGEQRPATYGEITVKTDGEDAVSPIGSDGRFYFENLGTGRHAATVKYSGGSCPFTLVIPKSDDQVIELGTVECRVPEGR
jgi:outer membrane usher protein